MIGVCSSLVSRLVLNLRGWSQGSTIRGDTRRRIQTSKKRTAQYCSRNIELSPLPPSQRPSASVQIIGAQTKRSLPNNDWEYHYTSKPISEGQEMYLTNSRGSDIAEYPILLMGSSPSPIPPIIVKRDVEVVVDRGSVAVNNPSFLDLASPTPTHLSPSLLSSTT